MEEEVRRDDSVDMTNDKCFGGRINKADLVKKVNDFTRNGLFLPMGYSIDPQSYGIKRGGSENGIRHFGLLTTTLSSYSSLKNLIEKEEGKSMHPGRFLRHQNARKYYERYIDCKYTYWHIEDLNTSEPSDYNLVISIMKNCMPSLWHDTAFINLDITEFSTLCMDDQVAYKVTLSNVIQASIKRLKRFRAPELLHTKSPIDFNQLSTGDGSYIWYKGGGGEDGSDRGFTNERKNYATLLLMFLICLNWSYQVDNSNVDKPLKIAYKIGNAYVFPYRGLYVSDNENERQNQIMDAIGDALNDLQRLISKTTPNQILIGDFIHDLDRWYGDTRTNERWLEENDLKRRGLDLILGMISNMIVNESRIDPAKGNHAYLKTNPEGSVFRVEDKHRKYHNCFNVHGLLPNFDDLQKIGCIKDSSTDLSEINFSVDKDISI